MRKLTYGEAKLEFEKRGYELLETEYKNNATKMEYICHKHPDKDLSITLNDLKNGYGCRYCGRENAAELQRPSVDEVRGEFIKRGYVPLFNEYINNKTKLQYQCPSHPDKEIYSTLDSIKNGHGCPFCAGNIKYSFSEARQEFLIKGYIPLFDHYTNANINLDYQCPQHPDKKLSISLSSLKRGHGCPYCAGNGKLTLEEVKEEFVARGYVPLFNKYKNNSGKLLYRCPKHPNEKLKITLRDFRQGNGCPFCDSDKRRLAIEDVKNEFIIRGYIPLFDQYVNNQTKLSYKCKKHPERDLSISLGCLKNGRGCPYCALELTQSKGCNIIEDYLKVNNIVYEKEKSFTNCTHERVLRFDFAIYSDKSLQCLIEFDGIQHFKSVKMYGGEKTLIKIKKRDQFKNEFCIKENIALYRIRYDELDKVVLILDNIFTNNNTELMASQG